jgi:tetratricopeptide (TPR) repeat protein
MLQELDRRNAVAPALPQDGPQVVKSVGSAPRSAHEWFWRVLAVLVLMSVCWVAWVAYQLQPRTVVTPLALQVPQQRPVVIEAPIAKPIRVVEAPKPDAVEAKSEPIAAPEAFKPARSIETPVPEAKPRLPKAQARKVAPLSAATPTSAATPATTVLVDKRERAKGVNEAAEARFRRAVALLNQARISEAEEQLAAALQADPSHVPARQAYVALLLEQQRVASALRLLREAVDASPAQPVFSLGLARIHAEQREYPAALAVIENAGPAAQGAEFQALRAAVLQRLGRHAEAVAAYEDALKKSPQPGGTWTGFAISLEALGRPAEAALAYQRALGAGPLPRELREYAEARVRALQ